MLRPMVRKNKKISGMQLEMTLEDKALFLIFDKRLVLIVGAAPTLELESPPGLARLGLQESAFPL